MEIQRPHPVGPHAGRPGDLQWRRRTAVPACVPTKLLPSMASSAARCIQPDQRNLFSLTLPESPA